jgi:anti-sigma factor RsiW
MFGHVFRELAAYAEGQLDDERRLKVERHLSTCDSCAGELARVRTGIAWAAVLEPEPMPEALAAQIRAAFEGSSRGETAIEDAWRLRRTAWFAAAAVFIAALGAALYWQVNRPWIRLAAAASPPTAFEQEGRRLHDRITSGELELAFRSNDDGALWRWLSEQHAPVTSMDIERPAADRGRFVPMGATVQSVAGARSSVLAYRIDGRPVTLVLALRDTVPTAPDAGWWSKRVTHRRDQAGSNTLTWTVGGGTYVMVSELDGAGQRACLICHTTPRFADALARLSNPGTLDRH